MFLLLDRHKQDGARSAVAVDSQNDPPGFCQGHMQTSSDARQDNSTLIEKVFAYLLFMMKRFLTLSLKAVMGNVILLLLLFCTIYC